MNINNQITTSLNTIVSRTSKLAIISLSMGILSILLQILEIINLMFPDLYGEEFFIIYANIETGIIIASIISAVLALLSGVIALYKIKIANNLKGRLLAITGIICGCLFIVILLLFLVIREFFTPIM